jgi:ribosome-binding ATPase YchF (GTP1/OBG family)
MFLQEVSAAHTLSRKWSGYGANLAVVQETLDRLGIKEPSELEKWDEDYVKKVVREFMEVRFPTVLVLNKIDCPESDANIARICQKYGTVKACLWLL